ncbi:MAG: hypothetical protein Q7S47_00120 [bacterium]|nr:hypothetical protein [bacterium]
MSSPTKPYGKTILLVLHQLEPSARDAWRSFGDDWAIINNKLFSLGIRNRAAERVGDILIAAYLSTIYNIPRNVREKETVSIGESRYSAPRYQGTLIMACVWHETQDFNDVEISVLTPENTEHTTRVRHHVTLEYAIGRALAQAPIAQQVVVPRVDASSMMKSEKQDTTMPETA